MGGDVDALAKAGDVDAARAAWQTGREHFPDHPELAERLAIRGDDELREYVKDRRSLEQTVDTDLSFYDGAG